MSENIIIQNFSDILSAQLKPLSCSKSLRFLFFRTLKCVLYNVGLPCYSILQYVSAKCPKLFSEIYLNEIKSVR